MKKIVYFGAIGWVFPFMVFLLAACSTTPPVKYYTLNTLPEMQQDVSEAVSGDHVAVGLGPVAFPKFLNRPQIVIRQSPNRVEVFEFHRWASSLQGDFLRVLAKNVAILLPMSRVAVYPWKDQFFPTYRVKLNVEQFDGQFGKHVILDVTWTVTGCEAGETLLVKKSKIREPVATENYEALVAAKSRALATLSRKIADEIKRLHNTSVGPCAG
jgi:hypothetical protein